MVSYNLKSIFSVFQALQKLTIEADLYYWLGSVIMVIYLCKLQHAMHVSKEWHDVHMNPS